MGCFESKEEVVIIEPKQLVEINSTNWKDIQFKGNTSIILGKCVDVYDGDTCKVMIKKEDFLNSIEGEYIVVNIRMVGINAAEIRTKDLKEKQRGLECKKHLEEKILDKEIKIKLDGHDKYGGRFLGIILPKQYDQKPVNSLFQTSINNEMLKEGYAKTYNGKGNKEWE